MADINENQLPALADRDMDLNKGVANIQEDLFQRPWDNNTYIPVNPLPTGESKQVTEEDKISKWFHDNTAVETNNPFSYENTHIPRRDISDTDKDRYNWFYPDRGDQEDIAARQQGTAERLGKSVLNMVPHFTHTLLESVTAPLVGTGYLLDGNKGTGFADNPYTKWLETWGQGYNVYESDVRKNANWWSPTYWASANSLNSVLGTVGDLAAFYVTGLGAGKLIGGATGGIAKMLGKNYNRAVQEIGKIASVIPEGQEGKVTVDELVESLNRIKNSPMAESAKSDAALQKLSEVSQKYTNRVNNFNKFQQATVGTVTNMGMAQSSAYQSGQAIRQYALQQIQKQGRTPTEEELAQIGDLVSSASTATGVLMTIMGATTLHGFLKGSLAKKEGEQLVRNGIDDIVENGTIKRTINGVEKEVPQYINKSALPLQSTTWAGKAAERTGRTLQKAGKYVDPWTGIGFMEFALAPASVNDYYDKKFDVPDMDWAEGIMGAIEKNVKGMASKEGIGSFMTGLIAGSLGVHGKAWGFEGRKEQADNTKQALDVLNGVSAGWSNSSAREFISSARRGNALRTDYLQVIRDGNKDQELTLRQQQWENYLYPRIKNGLKSYVDKDLMGERKVAMTDDGIRQLQADGTIPQGDDLLQLRQDYYDHLNHLQNYADNAQKYYDALQLRYGSITVDGKPVYGNEHMEKLMVLSGGIDDLTKRISELTEQIQTSKLSDDPKFQKRFAGLLDIMEDTKTVEKVLDGSIEEGITKEILAQIKKLSINPSERDDLGDKFTDLIKINLRKKQYISQYEDIIDHPNNHVETITQAAETVKPTGETIDVINGSSEVDENGKKLPSKLEMGEEYYIPNSPADVIHNGKVGKVTDFSKFRIVGQEGDNISISHDGVKHIVPGDYFKDKHLAKVSELDKIVPAKFAMDHSLDLFEYNKPKVKLEGQESTLGNIYYDRKEGQLKFRYRGRNGKIKSRDIDIKDTEGEAPKLKFHDTLKKLSSEELEAIHKYKESEAERTNRERVIGGKLSVIRNLVDKKKQELHKVENKVLDHEIKLEELQKQLADTRKEIEESKDISGTKRRNAFKKGLRGLFRTTDTLGKTINDISDSHKQLSEQADELREHISYLDNIDVSELPNGRELLSFINDGHKQLENIILDTGVKINTLSKIIDKARNALKRVISTVLDYIDTFEHLHPDFPHSDDSALRNFIEKEARFSTDQDIPGYFEMNPDVLKDLKSLKDIIVNAEDTEIPVKERDIKAAEQEIEGLYAQLKEAGTQLKVQDDLYDAFNQRLKDYEQLKKQEELLDSEPYKQKLRALQGQIDKSYVLEQGDQDINKTYPSATKPVTTVWQSGVLPSHGQHSTDHDNWNDRYNNFTTNNNLGFQEPKEREQGAKYLVDDPDYTSKMRIIVVTRQNQHHYFSGDFIPESYADEKNDTTNPSKASVAFIHVYKDTDGFKFIDQEGKVLGAVGDKQADPNKVVFIRMETAEPTRAGGYEKYHVPKGMTPEQAKSYTEHAKEQREVIVNNTEVSKFYNYKESLGTPNYAKNADGKIIPAENTAVHAKLVPESAIGSGIIHIETLKEDTGSARVQVGDKTVPVAAGRPILVYRNNVAYLDPKKLYKGDTKTVDHLYKVIKAMTDSRVVNNGAIDHHYTDYIKAVLNFSSKIHPEKGISDNQLYINEDGFLAFKLDGKVQGIPFTPEGISANKELIEQWLKQAFHGVDAKKLREGGKWPEIIRVNYENGQLAEPDILIWPSYEHYLLSGKTPEGTYRTDVPLTTNIKMGIASWDGPFKNKYIVPEFNGDYFPKISFSEPEQKKPEEKKDVKQTADTITFKNKQVALNGSDHINSGKNEQFGEFSYTFTPIIKEGKVEVTIKDFVSGTENVPGEPTLRGLEKSLGEALTKIYKEKEPAKVPIAEDLKTVPEEPRTPIQKEVSVADMMKRAANGRQNKDFMEVVPGDVVTETFDKGAFDKYLQTVSPQITFDTLPDFIKTGKGTNAWGVYQGHYIQLYEGAPAGTEMHEHYHAVEDSFLSPREIADTRTEFRNRKGSYVDRFGTTISYKEATEQQVREKLAEEFRQFKKTTPEYTQGSRIGNFFKRLYNFIKHIVLGNPVTVADIFKRINSSYYRDTQFTKPADGLAEYSEIKGMNETEKKWVLQGLFERVLANLRDSHGDLVSVTDGKITPQQVFDPLFKSMEEYYTNPESDSNIWLRANNRIEAINKRTDLTDDQKEQFTQQETDNAAGAWELWNKVTAEKEHVIADLRNYMKKYRLVFRKGYTPRDSQNEADANYHNEVDSNFENNGDNKDRGYETEYLAIDAKQSAPMEVKLLFASLTNTNVNPNLNSEYGHNDLQEPPSKLTPFLLPETVDSGKYMHRVLDEVSGITDPSVIQERLFEMAKADPVLVRLYNGIYKPSETANDWRMKVSFYRFAANIKPRYLKNYTNENGETIVTDANFNSDSKSLLGQWESDLRGDSSGLISINAQGLYQADTNKLLAPKGEQNTVKFLQQLKLPVTTSTLDKLSGNQKAILLSEAGKLYSLLRTGSPMKIVGRKAFDASPMGRIAKLLVKSGTLSGDSSYNNMDGNRVQNNVMFNQLTRTLADVNNSRFLKELKQKNPLYENDTWCRNSLLLIAGGPLFDDAGIKRKQPNGEDIALEFSVIEGWENPQSTGKTTMSMGSMNQVLRYMTSLNTNLDSAYANFIVADSKTEGATLVPKYITPAEYKDPKTRNQVFGDAVMGYLKGEIDLIKESMSGARDLLSGALDNDNYKKLQVYKDMLTPELVKEITDHAHKPGDVSTDEFTRRIRSRVMSAVQSHIDKQVEVEKEFLSDHKVLVGREKLLFYGINDNTLKSLGITGKYLTKEQVNDILRYRAMSLHIHGTEMRKLAFGPWYEVNDAPKRDKLLQSGTLNTYHGDGQFNKWHTLNQRSGDKNLQAGDALYHTYSDTFHQLIFGEVQSSSDNHNELFEVIGKHADLYKLMDEMDAQGIVLDRYWKEYKVRTGEKWADADEHQHQYDMALAREQWYKGHPKETYRKELKSADSELIEKGNPNTYGTGTPLKPLGIGMQADPKQSKPYADKTSIMRLTYSVAKDRGLEDLYWFMQENNIGMTGPKSMAKYGRPSLSITKEVLPQLYKIDNGKAVFGLTKGDLKAQMEIPWSSFNKIVETAKSKEGKTRASQPLSLITLNSIVSGVPVDVWNPTTDDLQPKLEHWNSLDNDQKREKSPMYRMWDDHNKAVSERSYRGYEQVLNKLGISEQDGKYQFNQPAKVVDYLKSEVTKRDLPDNVISGLDWVHDDDLGHDVLKYPLEAMANYQQLNNILCSLVGKEILSPKMNGTDNILVSSALMEKRGLRKVTTRDGKTVLASSELAYYRKGENGNKTSLAEVYAPNHLKKQMGVAYERNPQLKKLSDRELFDYLNDTPEGHKLLQAVGFRIPTQGINSLDAIRIKPWSDTEMFLPAEMGNSVIVPGEFVTKVGLDFDVDKMGTYHYNFYVHDKGYPRVIDFIEDTKTDEGLEKLYEQHKRARSLDTEDVLGDTNWKTHDQYTKQIEKLGEQIADIDQFIKENKGKDPWRVNSTQAIENKYYDTMLDILTAPHNFEQLVTPNSSEEMLEAKKEIDDLRFPDSKKRSKKDINYSNLLNPMYLNNERQAFRDATGSSIGIGAQNNTFHAQSQLAYLPLPGEILLPHKQITYGGKKQTVLSGYRNDNGTLISDFISQIINGSVDAVKDKWLIEMLQNKQLLSTATFLGRVGASPKTVFLFLNQPIIQEYIRQEGIYRDVKMLNPSLTYKNAEDLAALARTFIGKGQGIARKTRVTPFTHEELREALKSEGLGKELTTTQKELQSQVLTEFLKYYDMANKQLLKEQSSFLTANLSRVSETVIANRNKRVESVRNSDMGITKALEGKTFHSDILKYLTDAGNAKAMVTPVSAHPTLQQVMKEATDTKKFLNDQKRADFFHKGLLSFIDYSAQVKGSSKLNQFIKSVLLDKNNVANQLLSIRSQMKGDMKDLFDTVLSGLQPSIGISSKGVKGVQLTRKPLSGIEADMLTEAFRVLRDNPVTNELYKQLVTSSFLQTGVQNSRTSYHQYIPNEDIIKFMKPVIDRVLNDPMQSFNDTMSFYRNMWSDTDVVPMARQRSQDAPDGRTYKYYDYYKVPGMEGPNDPKFLALHNLYDAKNLNYPVIQVRVDAVNPETGNLYTQAEKDFMAATGDYSFKQVQLFQKVLDSQGEPLQVGKDNKGETYLYKQINAWGDGNKLQEHYEDIKPSVLDKHQKVNELPDSELWKYGKNTYTTADIDKVLKQVNARRDC